MAARNKPGKRAKIQAHDESNAGAAWVILNDRERYAGVLVEWAELWVSKHGAAREPVERRPPTVEERLEAHDGKQRQKKIAARRERWARREWRVSAKGNPFTRVHGFRVVVFPRRGRWGVGIATHEQEGTFSPRDWATPEEAKAGAFDVLVYEESKRSVNSTEFVRQGPGIAYAANARSKAS
jgi:hypothetical protein